MHGKHTAWKHKQWALFKGLEKKEGLVTVNVRESMKERETERKAKEEKERKEMGAGEERSKQNCSDCGSAGGDRDLAQF